MATKTTELEIINVGSPVFTKTARGGYNSLEIAYKNLSFEGKVEGKKLVDFNDKAVFSFVQGLKNGDKVVITQEKGEDDKYWKWVGASLSDGSVGAGAGPSTVNETNSGASNSTVVQGKTSNSVGRVVGSNYPTADERAERAKFDQIKHRQIGRQGCINSAIALISANCNGTPEHQVTVDKVLSVAAQLEKFVFDTEIPF